MTEKENVSNFVLCVEDSVNDVIFMQRIFDRELKDFTFRNINNGTEAYTFFDTFRKDQELPRVILLDIKIPVIEGISILSLVRSKELFNKVPVLMWSSSDRLEDIKKAYALGANCYMEKPKNYSDLKQTLPKIIRFWNKLQTNFDDKR